ncbi:glycosyltransferase [Avibacterium endocarditidis]|uniref:glycosyltransferase n=1 Tax=Avibacterium endocarditidis TaxID=380674 RepID=UPI0039FB905C
MDLKKYVLVQEHHQGIVLNDFLQQPENRDCQIINAITPKTLALLPDFNLVFNLAKAKKILNRQVTLEEIAKTLSHIHCWKTIAEDNNVDDNEFVIIIEPTVEVIKNAYLALEREIEHFLLNSKYNLFLLQSKNGGDLYSGEGDIYSIVYSYPSAYNNGGEYFYAIRKKYLLELLNKLELEKPYWKADDFSEFCHYETIAYPNLLLGKSKLDQTIFQFQKSLNPKFSVIIPVYNTQDYLEEALNSVLNQNFLDYEIILVDDGSLDNSGLICKNYTEKYPHITLITKANTGLSDSRNTAINIAKGEYILFLDSDDYWRGNHILSELSNLISKDNPDFVLTYMTSKYPDKMISHLLTPPYFTGNIGEDLFGLVSIGIWQGYAPIKIVKRELLVQNKIYFCAGRNFEDILWSFYLAKSAKTYIEYRNDFYIYRRDRDGAITKFVSIKNIKDIFYVVNVIYRECKELELGDFFLAVLVLLNNSIGYANYCYSLLSEEDKKSISGEYTHFNQIADEVASLLEKYDSNIKVLSDKCK